MRNKIIYLLTGLAGILVAAPAFAQSTGSSAASGGASSAGLAAIGAGIGMAIASGLCGIGQGKAAASACEGVARNPGARPSIFLFLILALIFTESLALYTLAIIFIKIH